MVGWGESYEHIRTLIDPLCLWSEAVKAFFLHSTWLILLMTGQFPF